MAKRQKDLTEQMVFRTGPDLRAALEADAQRNGRTVAQTVRYLLERSPAIAERLTPSEATTAAG